MLIIKLLSGLALIVSVGWFVATPGYEPAIAIFASLSALIAAWLRDKKQKKEKQTQTISKNGIGIQAGGNVQIGNIRVRERQ